MNAMLPTKTRATVVVGDPICAPTLEQVEAVARGATDVAVDAGAMERAARSEALVARLVGERRAIYGVTTGYGPLADNHVDPRHGSLLQRKLVYHLATGVGAPLPPVEARAVVVSRLATLARGLSAVRSGCCRPPTP